jgi:hypothetical protein
MPEGAVYVGRPSRWGNPFVRHGDGYPMERGAAVAAFRSLVAEEGFWWPVPFPWPAGKVPAVPPTTVEDVRRELAGKDLACWCPLEDEHGNRVPCHADVLLEIANPGWRPDGGTP